MAGNEHVCEAMDKCECKVGDLDECKAGIGNLCKAGVMDVCSLEDGDLLLLFLCSQLYLWGSPFWARFLRM